MYGLMYCEQIYKRLVLLLQCECLIFHKKTNSGHFLKMGVYFSFALCVTYTFIKKMFSKINKMISDTNFTKLFFKLDTKIKNSINLLVRKQNRKDEKSLICELEFICFYFMILSKCLSYSPTVLKTSSTFFDGSKISSIKHIVKMS